MAIEVKNKVDQQSLALARVEQNRARQKPFNIALIADYGGKTGKLDGAFVEVALALLRSEKIGQIIPLPVTAFSTKETGFWIDQLARSADKSDQDPHYIIYSNTAPRGADTTGKHIAWQGQAEQYLVYALLDNGLQVIAVNTDANLAQVKDRIVELRRVNTSNEGTQFRSKGPYADALIGIAEGNTNFLGEQLSVDEIQDTDPGKVIPEGYRNIKTDLRVSKLKQIPGFTDSPVLKVTLNGCTHYALNTLVNGQEAETGQLCVVEGSSGDTQDPFVEVILIRGRAAPAFGIKGIEADLGTIDVEPVHADARSLQRLLAATKIGQQETLALRTNHVAHEVIEEESFNNNSRGRRVKRAFQLTIGNWFNVKYESQYQS